MDNESGEDTQLLNGVAAELLSGFEKKDKGMIVDALTALISHLQMQDSIQDKEDMK
jgi:hypothetical protein